MPSPRPRYDSKADWADAQAKSHRDAITALQAEQVPAGDWRRVRMKMDAIARHRAEAARFDRIAARLRGRDAA